MINIKVYVLNKLLVSGESSFSAHDAARNAVLYMNNQVFVISWCFLVVLIVTKSTLLTL